MGFRSRRWALISLLPLLHCMAETPPEFSAFPDLPPVTSALHAAPATLSAQGETEGDWCSRVAIRPDRRFSSVKPCVRTWSAEELTREADFVLLGTFKDVLSSEDISKRPQCGGPFSHENNHSFIQSIKEASGRDGNRPRVVHMSRFELLSPAHLAADGFRSNFLLRTTTPLSEVNRFFSEDQSSSCRGKCRFSFRRKNGNERTAIGMDNAIDARGETGRHEGSVFYVSMRHKEEMTFSPHAVVADLRNAEYRAWRVKRVRSAIDAGGYDAVLLNHKFDQYYLREGFWLGSATCPDVARCTNGNGNIFSARPVGYGYAEYVEGWAALSRDLDTAGIPYMVIVPPNPWLIKADSKTTPTIDERELIRSVLRRADTLLLSASNIGPRGSSDRWAELLRREGANVVPVNEMCGYSKSAIN